MSAAKKFRETLYCATVPEMIRRVKLLGGDRIRTGQWEVRFDDGSIFLAAVFSPEYGPPYWNGGAF